MITFTSNSLLSEAMPNSNVDIRVQQGRFAIYVLFQIWEQSEKFAFGDLLKILRGQANYFKLLVNQV